MREEKKENSISRPPVVVVLGHIDHGKSSLLEAVKDLKITEKESGGITQHVGAYQIEEKGKKITFIDTPGHEAFSQMRSRGAKVADIAILVVDATEGVKAQTKEAISHIKESGIPVIVALNKMDKPGADPEKVKKELSQAEILAEGAGGKTPFVEISAKTGQGVTSLLELILLVAEMESLKADVGKPGQGVVVESYLDSLRGPTATLLLTNGVLRPGDVVGAPSAFAKIKSLENFQKVNIPEALPSTPVIIFGFNQVPKVGEEFKVFSDIEAAKNSLRLSEKKSSEVLEIPEEKKVLSLILKADVAGSIEAIEETLKGIPQEKVALRILKSGVGSINESDLKLANGGKSLILGFRVKIDPVAKKLTEREGVKIMAFEVIYDLVEGIRKLMEKIAGKEEVRVDLGKVRVLANFLTEKNRQIIGGKITEGEVKKGALIEVFRSDEKIGQGKLVNLQRNKKDLDVLGKGEECGILFEGEVKIEEGDMLVVFQRERQKI
jgi:translation initiation factor IF-2